MSNLELDSKSNSTASSLSKVLGLYAAVSLNIASSRHWIIHYLSENPNSRHGKLYAKASYIFGRKVFRKRAKMNEWLMCVKHLYRDEKRGYNPLKVENLVDLPPQEDPTDPLFQHQWYLVRSQKKKRIKLHLEVHMYTSNMEIFYFIIRKTRVKMVANPSWT